MAIAIVSSAYVPIERSLRSRGFTSILPFYDFVRALGKDHPLVNGWIAELTDGDWYQVKRILTQLDDTSRAHYLSFLAWRVAREEWTFTSIEPTVPDRFFIPEVRRAMNEGETFLDGGACNGEVARKFASVTKGKFNRIVAVEPDPENINLMTAWDRVNLVEAALSDRSGQGSFYGGFGFMSRLDPRGAATVEMKRIDDLDVEPTFVKLHLEGSELAALMGGRETFRRFRPIIAATVYHNDDGVWRTMCWLMENLDKYRFLFRNHCWCGAGAVAYAIPLERSR